jgi:hypothetical protein
MERAQPRRVAGRVVGNGPWDMDADTLQLALQRSQEESVQSQPTQPHGLESQVLELSMGQASIDEQRAALEQLELEMVLQLSKEPQMSASEIEMVMERTTLLEEFEQQHAASGSQAELALSPFADLPEEAADKERRLRKQVRGICLLTGAGGSVDLDNRSKMEGLRELRLRLSY